MYRDNQEGKTPLRLAIENGHITCAQLLRNAVAPERVGNRKLLVKQMAEQLCNEAPDYKKSVISKQVDNIEKIQKPLVNRIITRQELIEEQMKLTHQAVTRIKKEIDEGAHGDGVKAANTLKLQVNEIERMDLELQSMSSPSRTPVKR